MYSFEARVRREVIETVLVKVRADSPVEALDLAERVVEDPHFLGPFVTAFLVENREIVGMGDVLEIEPLKDFNDRTKNT